MKDIIARIVRTILVIISVAATWWFANCYVSVFLTTYLCYVAVFAIKKKREKTQSGTPSYMLLTVLGYIFLIPGMPLDWLLNMLSTIPFADKPDNMGELFTGRMRRYIKLKSGKRYIAAYLICKYLLTPFDSTHCGEMLA